MKKDYRFLFLKVCLIIAFLVIGVRLFGIQIVDHGKYVAKAAEQHISENVIEAERGEIYMMDGETPVKAVMNETVYTVVIDPLVVDEDEVKKVVEENAKDKMVVSWEQAFSNKTRRYLQIARNVSFSDAKKIQEAGVSGVSFEKSTKRVYPEGNMASRVLGFVNRDGDGQYGVEGAFDEKLSGTDGSKKSVRDVNGIALSIGDDNIETPAVDGEDVVLTLDRNIQNKLEQVLQNKVDNSNATNASGIVIDPRNGKVLAMANAPNYNPADYGNVSSAEMYKNYVLEEAFEPASVCKAFTFAAGVDLGIINRFTTFSAANSMTVDGVTFNSAYDGFNGAVIDMQTALAYSLNVGSATVLKMIGGGEINDGAREKLYDYFTRFGLGKYTGIELYEVPGLVPSPYEYDYAMNFTYANMTFGQGMNLTMMQVAEAYAAIINGGNYFVPTIIAGEFDENGEYYPADKRKAEREHVISEAASEEMRQFLWRNRQLMRITGVDKDGYFIGGKTGTGQIVKEDGSYSIANEETLATYVGFGGSNGEIPQYLVMVKVWGEGHYFSGEDDAQPLFNEMSDYLISYLKIKPNL